MLCNFSCFGQRCFYSKILKIFNLLTTEFLGKSIHNVKFIQLSDQMYTKPPQTRSQAASWRLIYNCLLEDSYKDSFIKTVIKPPAACELDRLLF